MPPRVLEPASQLTAHRTLTAHALLLSLACREAAGPENAPAVSAPEVEPMPSPSAEPAAKALH